MLKYALCEIDEFNNLKNIVRVFERVYSISDIYKLDIYCGMFPSVFVSRDDIRQAVIGDCEGEEEEDVFSLLTTEEMLDICEDLQDAYVDGAYWDDLASICENLKGEDND